MLGAFGAHALETVLDARGHEIWDLAVFYQLVHAPVIVLCALIAGKAADGGKRARLAGWFLAAGVLLFSGSLYLLALDGPRWLGPITPLGGSAFVVGWIVLLASQFGDRET